MTKKDKKNDVSLLLKHGLKEQLLLNLSEQVKTYLISYALDHIKKSDLDRDLLLIASMELAGKHGAAELAAEGIATVPQLKVLTKKNIQDLVGDYNYHQDKSILAVTVRELLIADQQEKLFIRTGGVKGEYHITKSEE